MISVGLPSCGCPRAPLHRCVLQQRARPPRHHCDSAARESAPGERGDIRSGSGRRGEGRYDHGLQVIPNDPKDSGQSIPSRLWSLWSSNLSAIICAASPGGQRITGRTRIVATIESRPSTMRSMYLSLPMVSKRFGKRHSTCKPNS